MPLRAGWASRTIVQLGWMIMKGPGALYGGSILSHKDHATNGEGTKQFIADISFAFANFPLRFSLPV
ncbi:hypothetical protein SERLA73DRAFT_133227 [Serpula lacrymans var. lacrymans S7.3]|uniref:Uncharacterized protein n=1 Tax=Serpula lacrymans var. lacrymans (strain S7.3) TaxID=936435 RepID=F8PQU6_SERL3|nr:hypothetical protein SERLA73DRAFT_133227 [Serpula lacrymans var. lacrymans S7.3]